MTGVIKDYDLNINHYPGKANVVDMHLARSLSLVDSQRPILEDIRRMKIQVVLYGTSISLASLVIQPIHFERIKATQEEDSYFQKIQQEVEASTQVQFMVHEDGLVRFEDQVCVTNNPELKKEIMEEAYYTNYSFHPGRTKMYKNIRVLFSGIK